ncbi:hypothetical protein BACI9J_60944 [Bacillus altitudinis]|nr:hypothetical protein BACI9J_60944 [Bacillus altitudinis]
MILTGFSLTGKLHFCMIEKERPVLIIRPIHKEEDHLDTISKAARSTCALPSIARSNRKTTDSITDKTRKNRTI